MRKSPAIMASLIVGDKIFHLANHLKIDHNKVLYLLIEYNWSRHQMEPDMSIHKAVVLLNTPLNNHPPYDGFNTASIANCPVCQRDTTFWMAGCCTVLSVFNLLLMNSKSFVLCAHSILTY
ncbi:unnamed protein product [Arabis nemorensis]|uniref:Uncharacterized protein n=1 Tax=Arabis nemorensis TaxID=586526 RepID=A0A565BNB1_9BRAS|nr:unnamed protein product [Arabis nemorensis]